MLFTAFLVNQVVIMDYIKFPLQKKRMIVIVTFAILDLFHRQYHHLLILRHHQETLQLFLWRIRIHEIQAQLVRAMVSLEKKT